ncbi:MAG TPA: hypothetical protein VN948_20800 [Terriglobales bacterium]|nr:hypothetical protein [Terriglobales bacterium]
MHTSNRTLRNPLGICQEWGGTSVRLDTRPAALLTGYQNSCKYRDSGQHEVSYFCAAFGNRMAILALPATAMAAIFT